MVLFGASDLSLCLSGPGYEHLLQAFLCSQHLLLQKKEPSTDLSFTLNRCSQLCRGGETVQVCCLWIKEAGEASGSGFSLETVRICCASWGLRPEIEEQLQTGVQHIPGISCCPPGCKLLVQVPGKGLAHDSCPHHKNLSQVVVHGGCSALGSFFQAPGPA